MAAAVGRAAAQLNETHPACHRTCFTLCWPSAESARSKAAALLGRASRRRGVCERPCQGLPWTPLCAQPAGGAAAPARRPRTRAPRAAQRRTRRVCPPGPAVAHLSSRSSPSRRASTPSSISRSPKHRAAGAGARSARCRGLTRACGRISSPWRRHGAAWRLACAARGAPGGGVKRAVKNSMLCSASVGEPGVCIGCRNHEQAHACRRSRDPLSAAACGRSPLGAPPPDPP
jgi:hypothetical protein